MIFGEGPIIKNIAGDLNKLFLQGSRVGQPITNVEGDAAADQGTADLLAARDPVIQEVAVGMSGEESRHYTVIGTPPLAITDSLGKLLTSWSVDVLPYQEGTGDPSPTNIRPIHGTNKLNLFVEESYDPSASPKAFINVPSFGKNLCDNSTNISGGYYSESGNWTDNEDFATTELIEVLPNTTYVTSLFDSTFTRVNNGVVTLWGDGNTFITQITTPSFTTTADTKFVRIRNFQGNANVIRSGVYYYQLELGSSASSYEPYNATVYTGTIGSEGGESRWRVVDLGTLNWSLSGGYFRTSSLDAIISRPSGGTEMPEVLCEIYVPKPFNSSDDLSVYVYPVPYANPSNFLWIRDTGCADVTAFLSQVTGKKLIYKTITTTTFAVPSVTIPTPTGSATAWATAEDGTVDSMEITYVGKA